MADSTYEPLPLDAKDEESLEDDTALVRSLRDKAAQASYASTVMFVLWVATMLVLGGVWIFTLFYARARLAMRAKYEVAGDVNGIVPRCKGAPMKINILADFSHKLL
jgi:hypothetical protein